jgi:ribosomal subunit interface protein
MSLWHPSACAPALRRDPKCLCCLPDSYQTPAIATYRYLFADKIDMSTQPLSPKSSQSCADPAAAGNGDGFYARAHYIMCRALKRRPRSVCRAFKESLDFVGNRLHPTAMNLILSTHNLTLTKAIEDHLLSRLEKLAHLNRYALNARVTLERDRTKAPERQFSCSVRLTMPGPDLFAQDVESDLYAAIDLVCKKIEQQIRKRHNKFLTRKHKQAARTKRTRQEAGL